MIETTKAMSRLAIDVPRVKDELTGMSFEVDPKSWKLEEIREVDECSNRVLIVRATIVGRYKGWVRVEFDPASGHARVKEAQWGAW